MSLLKTPMSLLISKIPLLTGAVFLASCDTNLQVSTKVMPAICSEMVARKANERVKNIEKRDCAEEYAQKLKDISAKLSSIEFIGAASDMYINLAESGGSSDGIGKPLSEEGYETSMYAFSPSATACISTNWTSGRRRLQSCW